MNLNGLHRRLLQDVLEIGNDLPFVITGGYAVQAHGIVDAKGICEASACSRDV
jgi:hypothetical protein